MPGTTDLRGVTALGSPLEVRARPLGIAERTCRACPSDERAREDRVILGNPQLECRRIARQRVPIAPGERVEVLVDFGGDATGATVAEAYDKLYYIERAAQVQIYAMWTGQRLKQLPTPVVEKTKRDYMDDHLYKGPSPSQRHFDALKRILDRQDESYKT